ncbi:MAG: serine protease [Thermoplasmatota archaeon]
MYIPTDRVFIRNTASCLLFFALLSPLWGQNNEQSYQRLRPDAQISASVPLSNEGWGYKTFTFEVKPDIFAVRLALSEAPADLDLYIKHNEEIQSYDSVDTYSDSHDYNEVLFLSSLSDPPLQEGKYYIDVVYPQESLPFHKWNRLQEVPFKIELETISADRHIRLEPGTPVEGEPLPNNGMAATYSIEIPEGLTNLRVDLFDTKADLDLLVGYEQPVLTRKNADYLRESLIGRESIVLDGSEDEPELPSGTYYITVFDAVSDARAEEFSLQVSFQSEPPDQLLSIPRFPRSDDELRQAFFSTVEVIGEAGRGSGCLVSKGGFLLTNWHVLRGFDGAASEDIYVAVSFSQQAPPQELFKAELIEYDEKTDLALLRIESGLYDQPLPRDYEFPFFTLADTDLLQLGQPLSFIGYPKGGGSGSRVTVSLTRGIVSGFDQGADDFLIKTDAVLTPGNSGGAAINAYYELVGLPTFTMGEKNSPMGFIRPVSEIPSEWLEQITRRRSF